LAKKVDSLPLTTDYMIDWERRQSTFDETAAEDGRQLDKDPRHFGRNETAQPAEEFSPKRNDKTVSCG
jgi:hypothetical protein